VTVRLTHQANMHIDKANAFLQLTQEVLSVMSKIKKEIMHTHHILFLGWRLMILGHVLFIYAFLHSPKSSGHFLSKPSMESRVEYVASIYEKRGYSSFLIVRHSRVPYTYTQIIILLISCITNLF
jgi:hypothetical protein